MLKKFRNSFSFGKQGSSKALQTEDMSTKKEVAKKDEDVAVDLFTPVKVGTIGDVKNRVAMAAMTRARATPEGVVGKHQVLYYTQRAKEGSLIMTEGVNISPRACGWGCAPGIFTEEQKAAWKPVTDGVHGVGGVIVLQLWHTGRASHSDLQPDGSAPLAPSPIGIVGEGVHVKGGFTGMKPHEVPRQMSTEEIAATIQEFVSAAKASLEVGFDGVELHGSNGYLIDEFLQSSSNQRTDKYGGSVEKRMTFLNELLAAMTKDIPASKIGIKLGPNGNYNASGSADNIETFTRAIEICAQHKLAYIEVVDGLAFGAHNLCPPLTLDQAMQAIKKVQPKERVTLLMGNCGYDKDTANAAIKAKSTDMISFGRPWIANPDLPTRYKNNYPLTQVEGYGHLYSPLAEDPNKGYTEYKDYVPEKTAAK